MYNAKTLTYCVNCKKVKRAFKGCVDHHHSLVHYDPNYSYGVDDEDRELIFRKRWIDVDKTPILPFKEFYFNRCPVHGRRPVGYCITCRRLVCFEEHRHFDHDLLLFTEHSVPFEKDVSNDDALMYGELTAEMESIGAAISRRSQTLDENVKLQETIIRELGKHLVNDSSFFIPHIIKILNVITSWKRSDGERDMNRMEDVLEKLADEREALIVNKKLIQYKNRLIASRKRVKASDRYGYMAAASVKAMGHDSFRYTLYNDGATMVKGEYVATRNGIGLPLWIQDHSTDIKGKAIIAVLNRGSPVYIYNMERMGRNSDRIDESKHVLKRTSTNYSSLESGTLYFIDENDDIVRLRFKRITNDAHALHEEVIPSKYKFKRILTLFKTTIPLVAVTIEGDVVCMDNDGTWHVVMQLPYDKLLYYVGKSTMRTVPSQRIQQDSFDVISDTTDDGDDSIIDETYDPFESSKQDERSVDASNVPRTVEAIEDVKTDPKQCVLFSKQMAYRPCRPSEKLRLDALSCDEYGDMLIHRGTNYYNLHYVFDL